MSASHADPETLKARFWAKVDKDSIPGCWIWTGASNHGVGAIKRGHEILRAPRVSWEMHFGPIPDGMRVLQTCRRPDCVAPHHLFLATVTEGRAYKRLNPVKHSRNVSATRKLTDQDVLDIRESSDADPVLAKRYGVKVAVISFIKARKTWTHLP